MNKDEYTERARAVVVTKSTIYKTKPGDLMHPSNLLAGTVKISEEDAARDFWYIIVETKAGFDQENQQIYYAASEKEAKDFVESLNIKIESDDTSATFGKSLRDVWTDGQSCGIFFERGDQDLYKPWHVFSEIGIIDREGNLSSEITSFLGDEFINWAKVEFGGNWAVAAELEYCLHHFPRNSIAYIAAEVRFNFFIRHDDFSAGYGLRDLELLMGGAEKLATEAVGTREKAGEGGSKASRSAKAKRIEMFMAEIEGLADLAHRVSEQAIVDQAFRNAVARDEQLWKQGKGRQADYEIELRSTSPYKERYQAVFSKTA